MAHVSDAAFLRQEFRSVAEMTVTASVVTLSVRAALQSKGVWAPLLKAFSTIFVNSAVWVWEFAVRGARGHLVVVGMTVRNHCLSLLWDGPN